MTGRVDVTKPSGQELVERLFAEFFNGRDPTVLDELVAEDYLEHARPAMDLEPHGHVDGHEHLKGVLQRMVGPFPDIRWEVVAIMSDENLVASRVVCSGSDAGVPTASRTPTGRRFSVEQHHWHRAEAGRLVEHWAARDDLAMLLQLGWSVSPP